MIKRHTFENGLQLVYQKSEQIIPVTCMYLFCNVGSAYEIDPIRGASHFVEHMCFKGTSDYIKPQNMLREYNNVGADINAFTEKRVTCYTLTCDDEHLKKCMTTFANMILNAVFSKKEFDKEQHVIIEENIRTKDNHSYMLQKLVEKTYFAGSSYEHPIDIITYHPSATHLKREDIYQWYKWFYHPSNMVCSVISNLSFTAIQNIIKTTEFIKNEKPSVAPMYLSPICTLKPILNHFAYYKKKGISSTFIHVGFRTCSYYSHDKYTIQLLLHVLNGISGRLFTLFRTKRGLTYHSSAHVTYYEHMGYMNFYIQTDPKKLIYDGKHDGIIMILTALIKDLIHNGITDAELHTAKGNYKGKMLIELQSINTLAEYNGMITTLQCDDTPFQDTYEKYIASITRQQICNVIKKYMTYENIVVGFAHDHEIPTQKIEKMFSDIF